MKKQLSFIAICVLIAGAASFKASAAPAPTAQQRAASTANNGQALEIAPPVITLTANPGQSVKAQIFLRDISSGNLLVTGQVNDFVAAGEDGTPKILLKDEGNNPYSLKSWVAPLPKLLLIPREIKSMTATINVPANASPGGHYGVVRFTATPPELKDTGVSLSASLGALLLVTVNGQTNENLTVKEFSVNHNGKSSALFEGGSLQFLERFQNTGNVHVQPTGQVTITDMFGKKVAAVNVNLPPRNILPNSIRKFEQPLDSSVLGNKKLFGHYKAKLNVTYGTNKKVLASTLSFWVIPYRLIAIVILVLVGGFFGLRYLIKDYNRRIIERSKRR